jgi:hypothetical protein
VEKDHHLNAAEIIDSLGGMVTKDQAQAISDGRFGNPKFIASTRPNANVKETISHLSEIGGGQMLANITDRIYRIFNSERGSAVEKRIIVIGEEGSTLAVRALGKLAETIDAVPFERGDEVEIKGISISADGTGSVTPSGSIKKIKHTSNISITDYSVVISSVNGVDIIGMLTEIGPIRHIERLGGMRPIPVSSCILSDGKMNVAASFWGSSALATTKIKANGWVKLEFCNIKVSDGIMTVNALDSTRVLAHDSLSRRSKP